MIPNPNSRTLTVKTQKQCKQLKMFKVRLNKWLQRGLRRTLTNTFKKV